MPVGKKKSAMSEDFARLLDQIDHRIAVFDEEAARLAANLAALRRKNGRAGEWRDSMIAGIVIARHASLATRPTAHFSDIPATVVDPWTA
jgi:predicted nucleic acid-binding protein